MKIKAVLAMFFILQGCAQSSGVLKLGPDTYLISTHAAPVLGGEVGAKKRSIKKANKFCSEMGKEIMVSNMLTKQSTHLSGGTSEIRFLCLLKNDSRLRSPNYQRGVDTVIEIR